MGYDIKVETGESTWGSGSTPKTDDIINPATGELFIIKGAKINLVRTGTTNQASSTTLDVRLNDGTNTITLLTKVISGTSAFNETYELAMDSLTALTEGADIYKGLKNVVLDDTRVLEVDWTGAAAAAGNDFEVRWWISGAEKT